MQAILRAGGIGILAGLGLLSILHAQTTTLVTFRWDVDEPWSEAVSADISRDDVTMPCGPMTAQAPGERECTRLQPAGSARWRVRGVGSQGQPGAWSPEIVATIPGNTSAGVAVVLRMQRLVEPPPPPPPPPSPAGAPTAVAGTAVLFGGQGTTIDVPLPPDLAAGDLVVLVVGAAGGDTSAMAATGYTHVRTVGGGGTSNKLSMLWRAWQPDDPSPVRVTTANAATPIRRGVAVRVRGAQTAQPSAAAPSARLNASGGSTQRILDPISVEAMPALLLGAFEWSANDATYVSAPQLQNLATINRFAVDAGPAALGITQGPFVGSGSSTIYVSLLWAIAPAIP